MHCHSVPLFGQTLVPVYFAPDKTSILPWQLPGDRLTPTGISSIFQARSGGRLLNLPNSTWQRPLPGGAWAREFVVRVTCRRRSSLGIRCI